MSDEQQEQAEPQTEVVDPRWLEEQEEREKEREESASAEPEPAPQPEQPNA